MAEKPSWSLVDIPKDSAELDTGRNEGGLELIVKRGDTIGSTIYGQIASAFTGWHAYGCRLRWRITHDQEGRGVGAVGGAVAGGLIGAAVGHPGAGAAMGVVWAWVGSVDW